MAYHKRIKTVYIDDIEYVWCSHEKEYLPYYEFETTSGGKYKLHCMVCWDRISGLRDMNYDNGAKLRTIYVEEQSKLMLENIGYDFNSDLTIHQQFMIKNNLI